MKPKDDVTYEKKMEKVKVAHKKGELHDERGRFKVGNPGGVGNASVTKDRIRYQDLLRQACTDEKFNQVAEVLIQKAQAGQAWACKELFNRLMGQPKQFADIDIKQTNVDPKVIIQNITQILGLNDQGEEVYTVQKEDIKKIEDKDNGSESAV